MPSNICIMLVDNGSVKPAATLGLRRLAETLSQQGTEKVHAVSLRHADRINSNELDGKAAQVLYPFMEQQLKAGLNRFILLPLFFAKSRALTAYVPEQIKCLEAEYGEIDVTVADVIYPLPEGENRLVSIFENFIKLLIKNQVDEKKNIVLVDHGSPSPKVTAVRQHLTIELQKYFDNINIDQAVMERRDGTEYDFNGPLLEEWLIQKAQQGEKSAIVALMFFLPGRHAGEGGDIIEICKRIQKLYPEFSIQFTPLVYEHIELINILQSRWYSVMNSSYEYSGMKKIDVDINGKV